MPTSCSTLVRRAVFGIITADATIKALCDRETDVLVQWRTAVTAPRPVLAYLLSTNAQTSGTGDARSVQVLFAGLAEGDGALDTAEALVQRARELLTPAAFLAQGLDAWIDAAGTTDRGGETDELPTSPTSRARADLDLLLRVTAPQT